MARTRYRTRGTNSVYYVRGRGWVAQRERPRPDSGKRPAPERRRFATKIEATRQAAAWAAESRHDATPEAPPLTARLWGEHWLASKQGTVSAGTLASYHQRLNQAMDDLGDVPLTQVTPMAIRAMIQALPLTPQGKKHTLTTLRMAMRQAVADGVLARNPCDLVEPPRVERYPAYAMSRAERRAFLDVAATHRLAALWHLYISYGPRVEELLAMHYSAWQQETQRLHIRKAKGDRERFIPLTDADTAVLREHWRRVGLERQDHPAWQEHGYLFPSDVGTRLSGANVRRAFKILLAKAKLPRHIRIHDLRHTAATHMLQAGIDVATVQYITGHRDPQTLIGIYGHAHLDRTRAAAVQRELYLDGS